MRRYFLFVFVFNLILFSVHSQDMIVRINGDTIACNITSIDSLRIYFLTPVTKNISLTYLPVTEVKSYEFGVYSVLDDRAIYSKSGQIDKITASFGFGFDHGGIGTIATGYILNSIGLQMGLGWAFSGVHTSLGIRLRTISVERRQKVIFFLQGHYGFSSGLNIWEDAEFKKYFSGPAFGIGLDIYPENNKTGYFRFDERT